MSELKRFQVGVNSGKCKKIFTALLILSVLFTLFAFCGCSETKSVKVVSWNVYQGDGDTYACVSTLNDISADVVCLQEVTPSANENIVQKFLESSKFAVACSKIGEKVCRTPILYDAEKFVLQDSGAEVFADSYQGNVSKSISWCVFAFKNSGEQFVAVNVHCAVARNKYEGLENYTEQQLNDLATQWRLGNVRQINSVVESLFAVWGEVPVFVCGDFNFNAESEPYALMRQFGYVDSVADAFKTVHVLGEEAEAGLAIDHVFVNDMFQIEKYWVVREDIALLASDHCALVATLVMRK